MTNFEMIKNKRIILLAIATIFGIWCVKGYFSHDPILENFSNTQPIVQPFRSLSDDKDKLIGSLRAELARLKKHTTNCIDDGISDSNLPTIYAITPTYARPVQKAELTRLSHTLMLVPNLHWIIVEDSEEKTPLVTSLLASTGLPYTHLNAATPKNWKRKSKEPTWVKPRGVLQRNTALQWIRDNLSGREDGVVYFADDDNSYTLNVFEEMRHIKKVGVWPVGLVGGLMVERPKVDVRGKVIGWLTVWGPHRPFAIDMAGFAVNLKHFLNNPEGMFAFESERGFQESEFLKHFATLEDLEVKADNCTKVYVWHTRTEAPNLKQEEVLKKAGKPPSNVGIEV